MTRLFSGILWVANANVCVCTVQAFHPLDSVSEAIIVPQRIIRSWYTGRWWVGCYIWYSEEGPGRTSAPPSPFLAVPNVTAHPSTASVPITVLLGLYNGPLLCSFNVAIKGLICVHLNHIACSCAGTISSNISLTFVDGSLCYNYFVVVCISCIMFNVRKLNFNKKVLFNIKNAVLLEWARVQVFRRFSFSLLWV